MPRHFIIITHAYHTQLDTHPRLLNKTLIELTFKYSLYNTIETPYTLPSYGLKAPHLSTVCLLAVVYKYRKTLSQQSNGGLRCLDVSARRYLNTKLGNVLHEP